MLKVELTIEDEAQVLEAVNFFDNKDISIVILRSDGLPINQTVLYKKEMLNDKEYLQSVLKELLLGIVKNYDYNTDLDRYNSDVTGVTLPKESVDDNIIDATAKAVP